jgi:glycosyltransferase involved in cell wall biosynthesis
MISTYGPEIIIAARDAAATGGGRVAIETAKHLAASGRRVHMVVDSDIPNLPGSVTVQVTPFGNALARWKPSNSIAKKIRHFIQLTCFSMFARPILLRFERAGAVTIDHNLEAFGGMIGVIHNVFVAQYRSDQRSFLRRLPQLLNPTFHFRIIREFLLLRGHRVRAVVGVSQQAIDEVRPLVKGSKEFVVIHNGVDLERFCPLSNELRTKRRHDEAIADKFLLLFVGHEFERKRLASVIRALPNLPENTVLWVLGGRMSNVDAYKALSESLGVSHRVKFFGTRPDTERYFQVADLFVLPSDYENWPLVALEAMATGVPVLMTPVGCAPDIIRDGRNGFIIDGGPESIAAGTSTLLNDPILLDVMKHGARATAERYSWGIVASNYDALARRLGSRSGIS